jgi:sugar O-acyltransferase (sialic acid O-acetyltransferase NeuD family)
VPEPIIIWGAAGHARVVADIIRRDGELRVAGFIDDAHPERAGEWFEGARILGGREALGAARAEGVSHLIVAFGNCDGRAEAARFAVESGFVLTIAVHPSAVIAASAKIGAGTVIAANVVVNPGTTIGENVILNTSCSVDHDCAVGNLAHIAPGARLAGNVRVGNASWIGIGAVVSDGLSIGARSVIGAGAVVVSDIPDGVVAYGVPARVMRSNS